MDGRVGSVGQVLASQARVMSSRPRTQKREPHIGAGEAVQELSVCTILEEDPSLIPSTSIKWLIAV